MRRLGVSIVMLALLFVAPIGGARAASPVPEWSTHVRGAVSIAAAGDGSFFIAGGSGGTVPHPLIRSYDSTGQLVWSRPVDRAVDGSGGADDVAAARQGGAYVVASKDTEPDPGDLGYSPDRWVLERRSASGGLVWRRHGGADCPADTWASAVDAGGGLVAVAVYCTGDYRVRAYGAGGRFLWDKPFEVPGIARSMTEYGADVTVGKHGSAFAVASFEHPLKPGGSRLGLDVVVRKYSASGRSLWTRRWQRLHAVGGIDVRGSVLVVTGTYDRRPNGWTARLDTATGATRWSRRWAGFPIEVSLRPTGQAWVLDEDGVRSLGFTASGDRLWSLDLPMKGVIDLAAFRDGAYVLGYRSGQRVWRYSP